MDECLDVLRQAEAAEPEPGIEELRPDTRVHAHRAGDLLDVRPKLLAQVRDGVRVRDLQGQERVGRVLDQLGAIDGGDNEWRRRSRRTRTLMQRAVESPFQNWPVNLAQLPLRALLVHSDDYAVRMEKITYRGTFTQELRIGCHPEG